MALLRSLVTAAVVVAVTACGGSDQAADDLPDTVADFSTTTSTAPPATSTTLSSDPCVATVQQLEGAEDLPAGVDLVRLAENGGLAPLPVPGAEAAEITDKHTWSSPEEYVANATIDDPTRRIADMKAAGHVVTLSLSYTFGRDQYGAIIHEFGSPEQAEAYRTIHLTDTCPNTVPMSMRPMPAVTGGASYYRTITNPPLAHGAFVIGRYEVSLNICFCVEEPDRQALADRWAATIIAELNTH